MASKTKAKAPKKPKVKRVKLTPEQKAERARNRYLLKTYGITLDTYNLMLSAQNGRCAVCRRLPGKRNLAVDHNHTTGQVRGLCCYRCNYEIVGRLDYPEKWHGILARRNLRYFRRGIEYMERWREHGRTNDTTKGQSTPDTRS